MYECGHLRSAVYYSEQRTKSKEKKRECVIEFVHKFVFKNINITEIIRSSVYIYI